MTHTRSLAHRLGVCRIGVGFTVFLLLDAPRCQDAIRVWGGGVADTDAYALAIQDYYAGPILWIQRVDGRFYRQGLWQVAGGFQTAVPPTPPPGESYVAFTAPADFGLGLLSNGTIVGWAYPTHPLLQIPALPPNLHYVKVVGGQHHALALRSDGSIVGWPGAAGPTLIPALPPNVTVLDCYAGIDSSHMLLSNGAIVSWGLNGYGECNVAALPPGLSYTKLFAGDWSVIAQRSDGAWVAWGDNVAGQLSVPAPPVGLTYVDISIHNAHALALRSDGQMVAWGDNSYGQCSLTPIPSGVTVSKVGTSYDTSYALLSDGRLVSWGSATLTAVLPRPSQGARWTSMGNWAWVSSDGEAYLGGQGLPPIPAPPPGTHYTNAYWGTGAYGLLRSDGQVFMAGYNYYGQLNLPPAPLGNPYVKVAMSSQHTIALRADGNAVSCGAPNAGVLLVPPPPPGQRYVDTAVNYLKTLLVRSDGTILVLGYEAQSPALPAGLKYVRAAAMFTSGHSVALRSDGHLVTFAAYLNAMIPALPPGVVYVEVAASDHHCVARRSDGQVVDMFYPPPSGVPMPPLQPGESAVEVGALGGGSFMRVGPTSTYVTVAPGCTGSLGEPTLVPRDTPRIGKTLQVTVFGCPLNAAFLVFGWSQTTPAPLSPLGMPGCLGHVSFDAAALLTGQDQQVVFELPIPNVPSLVGLHFYNQAIVPDPGVNAFGAVVSGAAEAVVGHW